MNLIVNSELFEAFTKVLHYLKIHKIDYIKTNDIKIESTGVNTGGEEAYPKHIIMPYYLRILNLSLIHI